MSSLWQTSEVDVSECLWSFLPHPRNSVWLGDLLYSLLKKIYYDVMLLNTKYRKYKIIIYFSLIICINTEKQDYTTSTTCIWNKISFLLLWIMNSLRVYIQCISTLHLIQTNEYLCKQMMSDISAVTWVMCVLLQVLNVDRNHSTRY